MRAVERENLVRALKTELVLLRDSLSLSYSFLLWPQPVDYNVAMTFILNNNNNNNSSTVSFFSELSRRISTVSGDIRESSYLFQCVAITIQRFNSAFW